MTSTLTAALDELTEAQRTAVQWQDGALLVLAGPGSGKTRVLTTRIARVLEESADRAFRVLALTFTNLAADEMSARVMALAPSAERRAVIGTFHSFCMQVLQQHGSHIGIRSDFSIYSLEDDRHGVLAEALRRSGPVEEAPSRYLAVIDKLKARLIPPSEAAKHFRDQSQATKIARVYAAYEQELERSNALDFASLTAKAFQLITSFPGIAALYRRTYTHWLIDEFQDTTDGQYRLIKAMAGDSFRNMFVVADDDQIIYQWNGASFRQLERYRADFQPTLIQLPTNYRCPPAIVAAANRLVSHNTQRTSGKQPLESGKTTLRYPIERHIAVKHFCDDVRESKGIAADVYALGRDLWGRTAVLARNRTVLEHIQTDLAALGAPAVIAQRRDDFRSPQFRWLHSVLRQSIRPLDRMNFETLVNSFNRWFDTRISAEFVAAEAQVSARSFLEEWVQAIDCGSPECRTLVAAAGAVGLEPKTFRVFVDQVLAACNNLADSQSDLSDDAAAWRDLNRSITQAVGRDAPIELFLQELGLRSKEPPVGPGTVSLMTIHGAKGKEFDHVYLVGVSEDILPSFQSLKTGVASAQMEEERRNCFVAITRARECLTISLADRYKGWKKSPSRFLTEMGLDIPEPCE